mmetsp:Transcript_25511/g.72201  ORF Transcript_25511/g.72201 Transcript_25511/m.72201 type:complete len:224 (+) Transcript_25511:123-794(+)
MAGGRGRWAAAAARGLATRASSKAWVRRQAKDPFVRERKESGYRARSAFKLAELDDRLRLLRPGRSVVDLGAAPGGWTQVALERMSGQGSVVMSDLLPIEPLPGAAFVQGDFQDPAVRQQILERAGGGAVDLVLSDMAPNTTGNADADHLRQIDLAEDAFSTALELLRPDGAFLVKVFSGREDAAFARDMQAAFLEFKRIKPKACRAESRELYFFGRGLRSKR